jgi:drug/metabolite transporter (DMT)-like permease
MRKPMFLFYFSITLAVLSSALYHFSAKSVPTNVNFVVSLVVTYLLAIVFTLAALYFFPVEHGLGAELKKINWASIVLAVAVVGIEFGYLLMYRAGWNLGIAAVLATVISSLILVPVAVLVFKDQLNWVNVTGIVVCLAGLVMLNWKK